MFSFCAMLSLILVVAKIFSLVTFSWWICLAPAILAFGIKIILWLIMVVFGIFLIINDE